jgi:predicted cation transporter
VTWLAPYDLIFTAPIVAIGVVAWTITRQVSWLTHPLFLAALGILSITDRIPWPIEIIAISIAAGLLVYAYGSHWIAVCTASPVPRATAAQFRPQWQQQLQVMAAIAGLLTGATLWSGATILKLAVITLPLTALAVPRPDGLRFHPWRVLADSYLSWITYHARPVPGLL